MILCSWILSPFITIIKKLVEIVRTIVETVCEWVSSVIRTVKTIVEEICSWLPWPLNKLCDLVTKVIEIFETVWDWICHDVIRVIFEIVEWIVVVIEYILKWVCWLVDWIVFRWVDYLLCKLGFEPKRCLRVCIKILTDAAGTPSVTSAETDTAIAQAQIVLDHCNVDIVVTEKVFVEKTEFLTTTSCDGGGMFSSFFKWFSWNTCRCCNVITIYFVQRMTNAGGCAYPGTDFIIVPHDGAGTSMGNVIVQEAGHLCDLWEHSGDPNNVMTDQAGGTSDQITEHQCCIIRSSRFVGACFKHG